MDQFNKTALVAGGGLAGLSAALFLDELGYQVTLVERQPIFGGRTYSFKEKRTGLVIDNGQHLLIGAYHETIRYLQRLGVSHKIEILKPTEVPLLDAQDKTHLFKLGLAKPPFNLLKAMFSFGGLGWRDKLSLIRLNSLIKRMQKNPDDSYADVTVRDWLKSLGQSDKAQENFWDVLTLATLNDDPDVTTADGLLAVLERSYFRGPQDGFLILPKVGLSELFVDPALEYLKMRGHKIISGLSLKQIGILDKRVQAFNMSDGSQLKADLFVSALPFRQLCESLPTPFLASHKTLKHWPQIQSAPIVSIHLFFTKNVLTDRFIGSATTRTHWFFNDPHKVSSQDMHGQTQTVHHVIGVISGAYDLLDLSKAEIVALALKDLARISPASKNVMPLHSLVLKEREATLSSRLGVNKLRPQQKVLDNFYIVGDWTKTGLPATIESAVMSSRLMADEVG